MLAAKPDERTRPSPRFYRDFKDHDEIQPKHPGVYHRRTARQQPAIYAARVGIYPGQRADVLIASLRRERDPPNGRPGPGLAPRLVEPAGIARCADPSPLGQGQ